MPNPVVESSEAFDYYTGVPGSNPGGGHGFEKYRFNRGDIGFSPGMTLI